VKKGCEGAERSGEYRDSLQEVGGRSEKKVRSDSSVVSARSLSFATVDFGK